MKTIICCIAKQEELYIKDFCDYHLSLGFDEIHIYDNNTENHIPTLNTILNDKRIIIHDFKQITENQQILAYNDCYNNVDYDWCAFIDIDEYIKLINFNNIKDFISSFNTDVEAIRLCWKVIGDDNKIFASDIDKPVYERFFIESTKYRKSSFKTIVKKTPMLLKSVHYFQNIDGKLLNTEYSNHEKTEDCNIWSDKFIEGTGYILHYMTKSLEEYINQKLNRGAAHGKSKGNNYYRMQYYFGINEITNEKIKYLKDKNIDISMIKF